MIIGENVNDINGFLDIFIKFYSIKYTISMPFFFAVSLILFKVTSAKFGKYIFDILYLSIKCKAFP